MRIVHYFPSVICNAPRARRIPNKHPNASRGGPKGSGGSRKQCQPESPVVECPPCCVSSCLILCCFPSLLARSMIPFSTAPASLLHCPLHNSPYVSNALQIQCSPSPMSHHLQTMGSEHLRSSGGD